MSGRVLHLLAGSGLTILLFVLAASTGGLVLLATGFPPIAAFIAVLAMALAHEQSQCAGVTWSDFRKVNGGPWNGLWDVLAFLPAPVLWVIVAWLLHGA